MAGRVPATVKEWKTPDGVSASASYLRSIQEETMHWWNENQRLDLPWRGGPQKAHTMQAKHSASRPRYDPYHIWVSEVMSQQTQLGTVVKYYSTWMKRFPTIETLAEASETDVRSVWSGMGYYRRAMYLREGARYLCRVYGAAVGPVTMPITAKELLKVPGIGPYTSAAIASVCYAEPIIAVDGNVVRVLCRLLGERGVDPKDTKAVKTVTAWGQQLMLGLGEQPCVAPGALNQGLMELGAAVCRPNGPPLCASCPLRVFCGAWAALERGDIPSIEGTIPLRGTPPKKSNVTTLTVVHEVSKGRYICVKRPEDGLLGGMLEFPSVVLVRSGADGDQEGDDTQTMSEAEALALLCPDDAPPVKACGTVTHIFSHIHMKLEVFHVRWPPGRKVTLCGSFKGSQSGAEDQLCMQIATGLDKADARPLTTKPPSRKPSKATERISVLSEAVLNSAEVSRLVLKVLHKVQQSTSKRIRV